MTSNRFAGQLEGLEEDGTNPPSPPVWEAVAPAVGTDSRGGAMLLRFGGLSGLGWLLDFAMLFTLVRWAHLPVFTANLISATTAAILVFLVSGKLVFRAQSGFLLARVLFYCGYTLAIIVVASFAIQYVAFVAASAGRHYGHLLTPSACAAIAKAVVTPLNFLLNFVVARFTSEHGRAKS